MLLYCRGESSLYTIYSSFAQNDQNEISNSSFKTGRRERALCYEIDCIYVHFYTSVHYIYIYQLALKRILEKC